MMRRKILILLVIVLPVVLSFFSGCGPTATDREWEDSIKGYWKPVNEESGELCKTIPYYHFGDSAQGATKYYKNNYTDTMVWEIRRKQMNIYYKEAVSSYNIGYNQYNSRALIHIRKVAENEVLVSQLYNSGAQSDYKLVRITPEQFYSSYVDTTSSSSSGGHQSIDDTF
jgi:hypothetical protein